MKLDVFFFQWGIFCRMESCLLDLIVCSGGTSYLKNSWMWKNIAISSVNQNGPNLYLLCTSLIPSVIDWLIDALDSWVHYLAATYSTSMSIQQAIYLYFSKAYVNPLIAEGPEENAVMQGGEGIFTPHVSDVMGLIVLTSFGYVSVSLFISLSRRNEQTYRLKFWHGGQVE